MAAIPAASLAMRVILFGTYDLGKPRTRILRRGLRDNGVELSECHADVWSGVADKTRVRDLGPRATFLARWFFSYPGLILRYLRRPRADAVVVAYLGHLDVLVLWPFAKLRGEPVIWDAFLSLYDTVVDDRRLVSRNHPLARALGLWEWLACRAADRVTVDTEEHAAYFRERYGLSRERTGVFWVGAEPSIFPQATSTSTSTKARDDPRFTILFYGQFIPLHGIETIVAAARLSDATELRWILIGRGQEEERIRQQLAAGPVANLEWHPWVEYEQLAGWIHRADLCLGIFGTSAKAGRVIPNKVFQILTARRPLVTRDSPAIRELVDERTPGVYLVPPGDPPALLAAVERARNDGEMPAADLCAKLGPACVTAPLVELLQATITARHRGS